MPSARRLDDPAELARVAAVTRFGRVVVRLRWPIALAWIAAAAIATATLPSIEESQTGALGDLVPDEAAAIDAELRSGELVRIPAITGHTAAGRSVNRSPASKEASSMTQTPCSGLLWLP